MRNHTLSHVQETLKYEFVPVKAMKERVTLTLERDILATVDGRIDGVGVKNRSHAVELLLRKALKGTAPSVAVILAGGRGSRSGKATEKRPRSLIEVHGRPILDYNIALCKLYGITEIILCVGYLKEQIKEHYGNGRASGVHITYLEEDRPLGTAGSLNLLRDRLTSTFLLMNADELKDVNIATMYQLHLHHDAKATIALTTIEETSQYGVAILDGSRIVGFVEKPKKGHEPSRLISAGLYLFEPEVIDLVPEGYAMVESDIFPKLAREGSLYGYPFSGQWFDTHTPERLAIAKRNWKGLPK